MLVRMSIFAQVGVSGKCGRRRRNRHSTPGIYSCFNSTVEGWTVKDGRKGDLARAFVTTVPAEARLKEFKDYTDSHHELALLADGVMYLVFLYHWNVQVSDTRSALEELRDMGLVREKGDTWVEV